MKKFYRVVLCIALLCIVLGFCMVAVGAAQGGMQLVLSMLDNNEFAFSVRDSYDGDEDDYEDQDYTFPISQVKSMDLDMGASVMEIKYEDVEEYRVQVKNNKKYGYSKCYVEDGVLTIESNFDYWGVSWGKEKANKITLVIPQKVELKEIELSLGAGSCTGDSLSAEVMDIEIGAGNLQLNTLKAKKTMELSVGAGNAEIDNLEAESLEIECEAGRCYAGNVTTISDINLNCDAGYAYLNLKGAKDSYNYDLECSVGSIKLDGKQYSGLDFSKETDHGADKQLTAECNVGAIEIEFNQ